MFQRILVPLDGSPGAERAIPVAAHLARQVHGLLILLHVVTPAAAFQSAVVEPQAEETRVAAVEQVTTNAAHYLRQIAAAHAGDFKDITITMDVAFGATSPTLSSTACLAQAELIVLCRHKEAGLNQWGPASTALQLMHHSPAPLLILNEHDTSSSALETERSPRILVPLDGSLFAESALAPALQLLAQWDGSGEKELCLTHVVDLLAGEITGDEEAHMSPYARIQARQEAGRYLQALAERLRKSPACTPDIRITSLVTTGVNIVSSILKQAEPAEEPRENRHDYLVAMATHGREGMQRLALGSVAERMLNTTTSPLLIVCPRETSARRINFALPVSGKN